MSTDTASPKCSDLQPCRRPYAGRVQALRSWLVAHPRAVGLLWLLGWVALLWVDAVEAAGATGVVWLLIGVAPLLARHQHPVTAFAAVAVIGAVTYLVLPSAPTFPVALTLIGVHGVALHRGGVALSAVVAAAAVQLGLVVVFRFAGLASGDDGEPVPMLGALALVGSLLSAAALLGINTRVRREYLRELEERARRLEAERELDTRLAVAAERSRIAGEMHDIVAHSLTVMITLSDGLAAGAGAQPPRPPDLTALGAVSSTGRQALGEMRRLLGLLSDDTPGTAAGREPLPGTDDLSTLLAQVRAAGLAVVMTREGPPPALDAGPALTVYRIVQEALTNTLKHSGPGTSATVLLRAVGRRLEVEVVDDGRGRPGGHVTAAPGGETADSTRSTAVGHGLPGMAVRAASYGGFLTAGPRAPRGWRVHAVIDAGEPGPGIPPLAEATR